MGIVFMGSDASYDSLCSVKVQQVCFHHKKNIIAKKNINITQLSSLALIQLSHFYKFVLVNNYTV